MTIHFQSGVNEDRLLGLDKEGIDREKSHAGDWEVGRKDLDIRCDSMGLIH